MLRDLQLTKTLNDLVINKDIKWVAEPESIIQYIVLFFTTERGSLLLSPNFGTNLRQLIFGNVTLPAQVLEDEVASEIETLFRMLPVLKQKVSIEPQIDLENRTLKLILTFHEYKRKDTINFEIGEQEIKYIE